MTNTNNITQGDNGIILYFNLSDVNGNTDILEGISTVECKMILGSTTVTKTCTIVDALTGKCSVTLASADISSVGRYNLQLTLTYLNGNKFTTNIAKLNVDKRI